MRSYESIPEDSDKNCEGCDITINYENDVLLIDLMKGCPQLYDKSLKDYKDQLMKEKSWLEISKLMQLSDFFTAYIFNKYFISFLLNFLPLK